MYELDQKWMTPFRMGTTSSITMQRLGTIVQRAPAVGAKMWCLSLCESRAPCVRGVHSSNKHCVAVYRPIWTRFSAFFKVMLFQTHYIVILCVASWRHNFGEIAVKNCEMSKKSAEKFVRTTSYR